MALVLPIFPTSPTVRRGYSIHKKPTFASLVHTPPSGREVTGYQMVYPLWEFELTYEVLRDESQNAAVFAATRGYTELQDISAFYVERNGQFGAFVYQDPDDYSRAGQELAIADGVQTNFLFYRTFGTPAYNLIEPVGIVDARIGVPIFVYVNGVLQSPGTDWYLASDLHTIIFTSPPANGAGITADFSFFYFCRFIDDSLELEEFMTGRWAIKRLRFRSARPDPVMTATGGNTLTALEMFCPNNSYQAAQFARSTRRLASGYTMAGMNPAVVPQKFYFEATMTQVLSTAYGYIGIAGSRAQLAPAFNFLVNGTSVSLSEMAIIQFQPGGSLIGYGYPTRPASLGGSNTQGDTIGVVVDKVNKKIWWRNATTAPSSWMGSVSGTGSPNPTTGNRGFTFGLGGESPITDEVYIFGGGGWQSFGGTLNAIVTLNTGDSPFVAAPPSGSVPWGSDTFNRSDTGPEIVISP